MPAAAECPGRSKRLSDMRQAYHARPPGSVHRTPVFDVRLQIQRRIEQRPAAAHPHRCSGDCRTPAGISRNTPKVLFNGLSESTTAPLNRFRSQGFKHRLNLDTEVLQKPCEANKRLTSLGVLTGIQTTWLPSRC